jgi:hypothetical protein
MPMLYTIPSTQCHALLQILYLDDTYLQRIYCCMRYMYTSTHLNSLLASISFLLKKHQNGKEEK